MSQIKSTKSQVKRHGSMNRRDLEKNSSDRSRDSLRTAYSGDENKGPARNQKKKTPAGDQVRSRRLKSGSEKTPIR